MKAEFIKIIFNIAGLAFSVAMILTAFMGKYFGKAINHIIKCKDRPESSFPCYGVYDIWIMIAFAVLAIYFLIKIIYIIYQVYLGK
jgi:hypothetical protein